MYTLLVAIDGTGRRPTIHLVDDRGRLARTETDVPAALAWLVQRGEDQVVAMTDAGPELFLIEPCGCPTMTLPALSLRRSHHGGCGELPQLPGLRPAEHRRARILENDKTTAKEQRKRRRAWLFRDLSP